MVPHRRALQAIILAAHGQREPDAAVARGLDAWRIRCPVPWREFAKTQIYPQIAADLEILITTTDFSVTNDYRPILDAAKVLTLKGLVQISGDGSVTYLPSNLERWRTNPTMANFLETAMVCEVPLAEITSDFRRIYSSDASDEEIATFQRLFVDPEYLTDDGWIHYQRCISPDEVVRRQRLRMEPKNFVRWKLGVPVTLDTEDVLRRLISDAYYTERLLKHDDADGGLRLSKDNLVRIKLERDTLFKGVKMLEDLKIASGGGASAGEAKKIQDAIAAMQIERDAPTFPVLDELT